MVCSTYHVPPFILAGSNDEGSSFSSFILYIVHVLVILSLDKNKTDQIKVKTVSTY